MHRRIVHQHSITAGVSLHRPTIVHIFNSREDRQRMRLGILGASWGLVALLVLLLASSDAADGQEIPSDVPQRPYYMEISLERLEKVDGVEQSFTATFAFTGHVPTTDMQVADFFKTPYDYRVGLIGPLSIVQEEENNVRRMVDFANSNDVVELRRDVYLTNGRWNLATDGSRDPPSNAWEPAANTTAWMLVVGRYSGTFKSTLLLADFPYDVQAIPISLRMSIPAMMAQFVIKPQTDFKRTMAQMVQWDPIGSRIEENLVFLPSLPVPFHEVSYIVEIQRQPEYYLNKIVSGIIFIVFMNWWCFALDPQDSNRMAICATLFLSIVAYLFLVSNDVPKVAYTTRLDNFITWAMSNIFITYFHHAVVYFIDRCAHKAEAEAEAASARRQDDVVSFDDTTERNPLDPAAEAGKLPKREGDPPSTPWWTTWRRRKLLVDGAGLAVYVALFVVGSALMMSGAVSFSSTEQSTSNTTTIPFIPSRG